MIDVGKELTKVRADLDNIAEEVLDLGGSYQSAVESQTESYWKVHGYIMDAMRSILEAEKILMLLDNVARIERNQR